MHYHPRWLLVLYAALATIVAVPAVAQQPAGTGASTAPSATAAPAAVPASNPAAVKKHHKRKHTETTAGITPEPVAVPRTGHGGREHAKPRLLGQYGDWGAYTASPGGKKICFVIAKPTSSEMNPSNHTRDPPYMFVSSRPTDKVSNEMSIVIGYPFKPSSEATLEVGSAAFPLYTQQDGAWLKNTAEEPQLVEAMRAGQTAVVKGVSAKGTRTMDVYSLRGFSQAVERTDQDCK
jgi:hypothetical protein